ncbi:MAG: thiazole synthase [Oligoflexales bacterium]|nr:thiazole synthase [Oligoflexales bacterium]
MLNLYGHKFNQNLIMGTARFPSPAILKQAIEQAEIELVTVSLRREMSGNKQGEHFFDILKSTGVKILPNTAGCMSVKEAVVTAHLARDLFATDLIKLEVIGDEYTLQPDPFALLEATKILIKEGFSVLPYMTEDIVLASRLVEAGCQVLMPWGSPIGSGQGIINPSAIKRLKDRFPEVSLILDAGIGKPSHALEAMELGCDAVMVNTAIALAADPVSMAVSFQFATKAGILAKKSGCMEKRDFAEASTPTLGQPFWHQVKNK